MHLLDTHVLLWWLADDKRLGATARAIISVPSNEVGVSAVSLFEIETKRRLGKLRAPRDILEALRRDDLDIVPLDGSSAVLAGTLEWAHRDPFDRLLVASSRHLSAPLLTADGNILDFEPSAVDAG